jgi:glucosylceramidase
MRKAATTVAHVLILLLVLGAVGKEFTVFPLEVRQQVIGAGAAVTGASAFNLMTKLTKAQRVATLRKLFSPTEPGGAAFSVIRISIGSCDFDSRNFSLDDIPETQQDDFELAHFSLAAYEPHVIPVLKLILEINPAVYIIASPWSAPAWMKVPRTLFGGTLNSSSAVRTAYAAYFRKFVEQLELTYKIHVSAVTVQNEPRYETNLYPSMKLTPADEEEMALLIAQQFQQLPGTRNTKVIVYDHNWDDPEYPVAVFRNSTVNSDSTIIGAAFHCYAGDVSGQAVFHQAFPNKTIFFTECSGGQWAPDFASDLLWDVKTLVAGVFRNWAATVLKWNIALDENFGPHLPSACDNCRGVVTIGNDNNVTFNEDFYSMAHLSYPLADAVRATRVASIGGDELALSVVRQGARGVLSLSNVLIVANSGSAEHTVVTVLGLFGACTVNTTMPAQSVGTFVWPIQEATAEPAGQVQWTVTTGDQTQLLQPQPPLTFTCKA